MILISHRGNINGREPEKENHPEYINAALAQGYDVEIDVWYVDGLFYLGHDEPVYNVPLSYLEKNGLWCHCKNLACLSRFYHTNINYFWHQTDDATLTSKKFVWTYPNKELFPNSIAVLPETTSWVNFDKCVGICSDVIYLYKLEIG